MWFECVMVLCAGMLQNKKADRQDKTETISKVCSVQEMCGRVQEVEWCGEDGMVWRGWNGVEV